jgi:hypothetical protein
MSRTTGAWLPRPLRANVVAFVTSVKTPINLYQRGACAVSAIIDGAAQKGRLEGVKRKTGNAVWR